MQFLAKMFTLFYCCLYKNANWCILQPKIGIIVSMRNKLEISGKKYADIHKLKKKYADKHRTSKYI